MNENRLDLKGLMFYFIGSIVSLISGCIEGAMMSQNAGDIMQGYTSQTQNPVVSVIEIAGFVLTVIGLVKLRRISKHFSKSLKYLIVEIILAIIVVILSITMLASIYSYSYSYSEGGLIAMSIVSIVLSIVLIVVAFLYFREFVFGLAEIPDRASDFELRDKTLKLWPSFKWAVAVMVVGMVVLVVGYVVYTTIAIGIGAVIVVAGGIWLTVIEILLLVRIWNVYKKYDGAIIGVINDPAYAAYANGYTDGYNSGMDKMAQAAPVETPADVSADPSYTANVNAPAENAQDPSKNAYLRGFKSELENKAETENKAEDDFNN